MVIINLILYLIKTRIFWNLFEFNFFTTFTLLILAPVDQGLIISNWYLLVPSRRYPEINRMKISENIVGVNYYVPNCVL